MEKLKHSVQTTKNYVFERSELFVGIGVVGGLILIVGVIALAVHLSGPQIVYQPVKACDLLTPAKAQDLLGDRVISTDANKPVITDNVATSKCSYTDENPSEEQMRIAAVAVRSAINDEGDAKNKAEFAQAKKAAGTAGAVSGVGDSAFFNATNGQLNVLRGHAWLIANYGFASSPQANTLDDVTKLARDVLSNLK